MGIVERIFGLLIVAIAAVLVATASTPVGRKDSTEPAEVKGVRIHRLSLEANNAAVTHGSSTLLSGELAGAEGGERIAIVDSAGRLLSRLKTDDDGGFEVRFSPRKSQSVTAMWEDLVSPTVLVEVGPRATVRVSGSKRPGRGVAQGRVRPLLEDGTAALTITRDGRPVIATVLQLDDKGRFSFSFPTLKEGTYRAELSYSATEIVPGVTHSRGVLVGGTGR